MKVGIRVLHTLAVNTRYAKVNQNPPEQTDNWAQTDKKRIKISNFSPPG
jgi:hypothetical protein